MLKSFVSLLSFSSYYNNYWERIRQISSWLLRIFYLSFKFCHFGFVYPEAVIIEALEFRVVRQSVQLLSCVPLFGTRLPCPSPTPEACSISCPLSRWCHPTVSSSVVPFSHCFQSFPASESFLMSQFFPSGGQSTGASASASVLPVNIQDWFPLGWTGLISLLSKDSQESYPAPQFQNQPYSNVKLKLNN